MGWVLIITADEFCCILGLFLIFHTKNKAADKNTITANINPTFFIFNKFKMPPLIIPPVHDTDLVRYFVLVFYNLPPLKSPLLKIAVSGL
jgi:hypothetical protein